MTSIENWKLKSLRGEQGTELVCEKVLKRKVVNNPMDVDIKVSRTRRAGKYRELTEIGISLPHRSSYRGGLAWRDCATC